MNKAPITKADVAQSIAVCLMRLGKNDWNGVRFGLKKASETFEAWLEQRPEQQAGESLVPHPANVEAMARRKKALTPPTMRELRNTPVRDLTPEQCRKLMYHHHGGGLSNERRKAYLFKSSQNPLAFFVGGECAEIEEWIKNEKVPQC